MFVSLRSLSLLALAGAGSLLFTGCYDDGPYYGRAAYVERPAYYDGPGYADAGYYDEGPDVDFYYVGGQPYSRVYGPLVFRDGGYYYRHGGAYVTYQHGGGRSRARGDYRRSREVVGDYRGSREVVSNTYRGHNYNSTYHGAYPSGAYAGRTTVRGTYGATTRAQVRTRPQTRGTTVVKKQEQ